MSTDQDISGQGPTGPRLAPRPVSRPPVDDAQRRAFGRPDGVDGSFVADELRPQKYRENSEYEPRDQPPDPVLAEAFGKPYVNGESLQRHPVDSGALEAEEAARRNGSSPDPAEDPWRDPAAAAALGTPAVAAPAPQVASAPAGKLGVRDVLFGGAVRK